MGSFFTKSLFLESFPATIDAHSYKLAKEAFVSDNPGSSLLQIYAISLTALTSLALYYMVQNTFPATRPLYALAQQFTILVIPLLLSLTVFARSAFTFNALLLFPAVVTAAFAPETPPSPDAKQPEASTKMYPPVTIYRAHLMILTILSILAVDFPVFPRSLGKTETFGFSLMDLGVGSFVFSAGIGAAPSLFRDKSLPSALRKAMPLLLLGLVRLVLVKSSGYPEHVTEYGTHWNFFFTLGLMPILTYRALPLLEQGDNAPLLLAVVVTNLHQVLLRNTPLQGWVLGTARFEFDVIDIVEQNKQGLVSLPGYFALYLLGIATGSKLPLRPAATDPLLSTEKVVSNLSRGLAMAAGAGVMSFVTSRGGSASRLFANTAYVAHTAFYNLLFLIGYVVLDAWFSADPAEVSLDGGKPSATSSPAGKPESTSSPTDKSKKLSSKGKAKKNPPSIAQLEPPSTPTIVSDAKAIASKRIPVLLRAINTHGLILFLLANVLTGIINLVLPTMYMKDWASLVVLTLYAAMVFGVGWIVDTYGAEQLYNQKKE